MAVGEPKKLVKRVNRKLTFEQASMVRNLYSTGKITMKQLATEYSVSISTINAILKNQVFKDEKAKLVLSSKNYIIIER